MPDSRWCQTVIREFVPGVALLTVVADPDQLLLDEDVALELHGLGFAIVPFEATAEFRYLYEERFRSRWDIGEAVEVIVTTPGDIMELPYDLLSTGRQLSVTIGELLPGLDYPTLRKLGLDLLEQLCEFQHELVGLVLDERQTIAFILRRLFDVAPEQAPREATLLATLLKVHHQKMQLPVDLASYLARLLDPEGRFSSWPLSVLLSDRVQFVLFLQERWPVYLNKLAGVPCGHESTEFAVEGPAELPFGHAGVRIYIDTLFADGVLEPVRHEQHHALTATWARVGLRDEPKLDVRAERRRAAERLARDIPNEEARHPHWSGFSRAWAEYVLLTHGEVDPSIQRQVDVAFARWAQEHLVSLINVPATTPVMVHHVARYLARHVTDGTNARVALVVLDGLALDQWLIVRDALVGRNTGVISHEATLFAWIPTMTSVSRQALFAGRAPFYFPATITTTQREPALWTQFWVDQGLKATDVLFMKGLGDGALQPVHDALQSLRPKVAGLVVSKVDDIMHGMQLGTAGMHNQVEQWAARPYLHELIRCLLQYGYRVFLTSDHGNIEAVGCGNPLEGAIADLRGERVRVYTASSLRGRVKREHPDAHEWTSSSLPKDYYPLIAPHRMAFVRKGERIVTHGGASIEETIVPFVEIAEAKSHD